ncbi:MAG: hypothetical protein ACD_40C00220G0002 [uncultured bacterium]|nr:MAG: hypothetical protein ACD_40C00220G0002 [uncultured bacterium]
MSCHDNEAPDWSDVDAPEYSKVVEVRDPVTRQLLGLTMQVMKGSEDIKEPEEQT